MINPTRNPLRQEMIMNRLKCLLIGILAMSLAGCGQTVIETLNVPTPVSPYAPGKGMTAMILPFADYSYGDNLASAHRRNLKITETLTDHLVMNGFSLPVQEDVFFYLVDQNVISLVPYEEKHSNSLSNELSGDWSPQMKDHLRAYLSQQQVTNNRNVASSPGTHGLTTNTIAKMARQFHADYIVRGRILEYKTRQEATWAPWKKGILPFITGSTNQILYGFAGSEQYDELGMMVSGGVVGALAGHNGNYPFGDDDILSGSAVSGNDIAWGVIGGALGQMSYNTGRVDQAVVQMRIWVQEAATGNVVWTNRIQVQVSPESIFADAQYDVLFDQAIEKGVSTLIDDFVTTGL
jgi:hypothetical protein